MIIRSIIEKIRKDLRAEHPELTPEQIEILAVKVYHEYQRMVLTMDEWVPSSPVRVMSSLISGYPYPGLINKKK
jgi:hypothetical protein